MPAAHRAHLEWSPGRLIRWGEQHGAACAQVIRQILRLPAAPGAGLSGLSGAAAPGARTRRARLEAACARALLLRQRPYQTVASILKQRTESLPVNEKTDWSAPEHAHLRGAKYYQ